MQGITTMEYVIVANGEFLVDELLQVILVGKHIIALDNAYTRLLALGIKPNLFIGDADSISPSQLGQLQADSTDQVIIDTNQQLTDLQKAIIYCDSHSATSIEIVCALGNRLDHSLFNIRLLRQYHRSDRPLQLHDHHQTVTFIRNDCITISGNPGDPCGLFAFPHATFTSAGLTYDGDAYPLEFAVSDSVANYLTSTQATIDVQGDALLIAPGYYPQQHQGA